MESSLQFSYQMRQNCRVNAEWTRSVNQDSGWADGQDVHVDVADVPEAKKCIGQVVLDWEFIHDLDLHLLKVVTAREGHGSQSLEPSPEPSPESVDALPDIDLIALVNSETQELKLDSNQILQTVVFYGSKVCKATGSDTPQAVLQLDRNAAVHSHKPVENLYMTETLASGIYVVCVHNYAQRQLLDNVIGSTDSHTYSSFEEFKKKDEGYQMMEKALNDQASHSNLLDGTPEKIEAMTKVDKDMTAGFRKLSMRCNSGNTSFGVHYGVTIYTYPDRLADVKHPQASSIEELQNIFKSDFFATSECVFNPDANPSGYNAANVLANTQTSDGKLALTNSKSAQVALLKVVQDRETSRSKIVDVLMLPGTPKASLQGDFPTRQGVSPMAAHRQSRMRQMPVQARQQTQNIVADLSQTSEPFPEPSYPPSQTPSVQQCQAEPTPEAGSQCNIT